MTRYLPVVITLVLVSIYAFAQQGQNYQDYIRELESTWDKYSEAKEFEEFKKQQDAAFQAFVREQEEAYRKYVEEVQKKWNEFIGSTKQQWVDYNEDKSVRSMVNFEEKEVPEEKPEVKPEEKPEVKPEEKPEVKPEEKPEVKPEEKPEVKPEEKPEEKKGEIIVEAVVPADEPDAVDKAKELIAEHVERIFSATNEAKKNVLEDQVKTKTGETVTPENVKKFVQQEVLPEAKVDPKPLKSKDGVERVKVSVAIPMVPKHLKIRAGQYLGLVRKYCDQYKEEVPLVMAVIQTESYFNPLAKSHIPAYGLMQIVPRYAGRDSNNYVFKKDEEPRPKDLYVPENNVLLGIAYLRILRDRYFYGIEDTKKQEYLIVASYNGGMGRVIKRVLKKYNVPQMSQAEVYDALRKEMPAETRDYLAKVASRKSNYLAWQ